MKQVPIVRLSDLSPAERKAYVLADNKLALNAGWDQEVLAIELQGLIDLGFDVEATGFALGEIEVILDDAAEGAPNDPLDGAEDEIPLVRDAAVTAAMCGGRGVTAWSAAMLATKRRTRRFSAMSAPT
jgi:ParB-like chromosome segregation protein Spo0J